MKLKNICVMMIVLFIFIMMGSVSAIEDNTTSDSLELMDNENSDGISVIENDNSVDILEKIDKDYSSIQQKSLECDNIISVTSDNSILSYSKNGVKITHYAKYTITYKEGSFSQSITFTLNDLEKTKNGGEFIKDDFTILYSNFSDGESYSIYYSSMLEGSFDADFTNNLAKGETVTEDYPYNYYVFTPNLWIHCDLNYYAVNYGGYTGKYASEDFENFIKGNTNYLHSDTGKYKTTKDAQYKIKWTKKWFYVGEVVLKKKVKYVNGLKIVKRNNVNYLTIGKVKQKYNKVVKFVSKYKKVNKKLRNNGWEYEGHMLKKIMYKNDKTIIRYYYKYQKSIEIFKGYKYYKNPCTMTLEHNSKGKKAVSIWYFDKADWDIYKDVVKKTFTYSI